MFCQTSQIKLSSQQILNDCQFVKLGIKKRQNWIKFWTEVASAAAHISMQMSLLHSQHKKSAIRAQTTPIFNLSLRFDSKACRCRISCSSDVLTLSASRQIYKHLSKASRSCSCYRCLQDHSLPWIFTQWESEGKNAMTSCDSDALEWQNNDDSMPKLCLAGFLTFTCVYVNLCTSPHGSLL